jgi:hypothetical protein
MQPTFLPPPALILALAQSVKMTPIAWRVKSDQVVIIFEQGPKIVFEREAIEAVSAEAILAPVSTLKKALMEDVSHLLKDAGGNRLPNARQRAVGTPVGVTRRVTRKPK